MTRSWHKDLSGDVQFVLKPHWMMGATGATHGSPHPYDTHVPVMMYGPPWVGAARIDRRVEVVDIAPTLAGLLGVAVPAAAEGHPLPMGAR
jgi:arylsulfatase A-like enzyme